METLENIGILTVVNLKIAGVDVSRGSVTVCILSEIPANLRKFKRAFKPLKFSADREGIEKFLALEFDGALLEPTGGHYSKIWAHHLMKAGKEVRWVGHREVAHYRESWREINKSDKIDAIVLACYGLERWNRPEFFIQPNRDRIKSLYLELEHFNRSKSPVINRLRQQLSHEFPEVAKKVVGRGWLTASPPGLWQAIANEKWYPKWTKVYEGSIGTGLSEFSQSLAKHLLEIERNEYQIELEIERELKRAEFQPYLEIFKKYTIGERTSIALLAAIYPVSQFLEGGKVVHEHVETKTEKRARRNRSLASFKLACGVGRVWMQSGDFEGWVNGGSKAVRVALWRWCKMTVVMSPNLELEAIAALRDYYENGAMIQCDHNRGYEDPKRIDPSMGNQRVMRVVRRMLTMLFRDLIEIK